MNVHRDLVAVAVALHAALLIPAATADFFYTPGLPLSISKPSALHKHGPDITTVDNLWYTSAKYTFVMQAKTAKGVDANVNGMLSTNVGFLALPVASVTALYRNIKAAHVPGVTLMLDFPYPTFPDNYGTWLEVLLPWYSRLLDKGIKRFVPPQYDYVDQVLFVNLKRSQIQHLQWVWAMLQLTLAPATAPDRQFPRLIFFDELEFMDQSLWLCFQHVVALADRLTGGPNGFSSPAIGQRFRAAAYELAGRQLPVQAPNHITYMMAVGGEVVHNNEDVLQALLDIADLLGMTARPASITPGASFRSFMGLMARTGVLVSRHGPQLANAIFLPPGALVVELLAFNWDWRGTSDLYYNATQGVGDIHHFGWRATHSRWAVYTATGDDKYEGWTIEECTSSRQCLEVHARSGMLVDTGAMHELLMDTLPDVRRNSSVSALRRAFPKGAVAGTTTGLWSDK